jgi:hypothetical protein
MPAHFITVRIREFYAFIAQASTVGQTLFYSRAASANELFFPGNSGGHRSPPHVRLKSQKITFFRFFRKLQM